MIFADGNRDLRNAVRGHFEQLGFITFLAAYGPEAIDFAASTLVQLVFLNYHLAPSNGLEACERMRALPGYSAVPILLMAHPDVPRLFRNAQRAGASGVVLKPFSVSTLLREIEPFLVDPKLRATGVLQRGAAISPGFSEPAPIREPGPAPQRKPGEGSLLTQGKLALDVYRHTPASPAEPGNPPWPRRR